tara:strand:+ start:2233 stop:3393 length:1161 start_codon:yes stop_codon:yes gene_type:complete
MIIRQLIRDDKNVLPKVKPPIKTVSLLGVLISIIGCSEELPPQNNHPRPIAWIKVSESDLCQVRRLSGILKSAETTKLSFEIGGKILGVHANLGDQVQKGQILAELDERSYQLNSQASKGKVQEAKAQLIDAENEFKRQLKLFKQGWTSKSKFDNARAAFDRAKSSVKIAQAQLDLSQKDLIDTTLRAPYDGRITARKIEPSQQVNAGQTCFEIEGNNGLEISVLVPETLIDFIEKNHPYKAYVPAIQSPSLKASVTEIGSQAEIANAFPVTLLLEKAPSSLRAGMTAEVDFTFMGRGRTGYTGSVIKVPPTALAAGEKQTTHVFVYDPKTHLVHKRQVQTENINNNEVMISKGLKPGEIIATAGVNYLHEGQKVSLLGTGPRKYN